MFFAGDSSSYRTIVIKLTEEQKNQIQLKHTYTNRNNKYYEQISQVILEEEEE